MGEASPGFTGWVGGESWVVGHCRWRCAAGPPRVGVWGRGCVPGPPQVGMCVCGGDLLKARPSGSYLRLILEPLRLPASWKSGRSKASVARAPDVNACGVMTSPATGALWGCSGRTGAQNRSAGALRAASRTGTPEVSGGPKLYFFPNNIFRRTPTDSLTRPHKRCVPCVGNRPGQRGDPRLFGNLHGNR